MKKNNFTKKIISGKYKGKTLNLPSKITTRSSKTIVLESFFNTIQFDIINSNFVEVFSGSGSIGLEALSRGAKFIYFMEKDKEALKTLNSNIKQTNPNDTFVLSGDSFNNITTVIKELKNKEEDAYFYIDPPFSVREGMETIYDKMIQLIDNLPQEIVKLIIIEHMTGLELPSTINDYTKSKSKKFGNTSLTYYKIED
jgi:16S rRNA (guanine(966)-N(2))-methyltransferase RsmD